MARGRAGSRWRRLTAGIKAAAASGRPCCRCGQRIDTSILWPHPDSFSTDHYPHPLSTHPHLAEDPANLAPAHLRCNQTAGDRTPRPELGVTSTNW